MFTDLLTETCSIATDILEGLMLAFVGVKPSRHTRRVRKTRQSRQYQTKKRQTRVVLNERAQLRLAGKLFDNLPRDVAISVLNDVKRCGMEV